MNIKFMVTATALSIDPPQFLAEAAVTLGHGRLRALGEDLNQKAPSTQMQEPTHQWTEGVLTNGNQRPTVIGGQVKERHRTHVAGQSAEGGKDERKGSFKEAVILVISEGLY